MSAVETSSSTEMDQGTSSTLAMCSVRRFFGLDAASFAPPTSADKHKSWRIDVDLVQYGQYLLGWIEMGSRMSATIPSGTSTLANEGSSSVPPLADRPALSYSQVDDILGPLLFRDDYIAKLPGKVRWILRETVKKTDPSIAKLKTSGRPHPAIKRKHPIISADEIREALAMRAYYDYQTVVIDKWLTRKKVPDCEPSAAAVDRFLFESALLNTYPSRARELKKKLQTAASYDISEESALLDEPHRRGRGGRPPFIYWERALVATTVAVMMKTKKVDRTEVKEIMRKWFRKEPIAITARPGYKPEPGKDRLDPKVDTHANYVWEALPFARKA